MSEFKFNKEDTEFIYNLLRQGTVKWKGRQECLRLASKRVLVRRSKAGNPIYKLHWQCASCKQWYRNQTDLEVDHIIEIGGVTSFNGDWNEMISKIMPRPVCDHLQALCLACHMRKTNKYTSANLKYKRKK